MALRQFLPTFAKSYSTRPGSSIVSDTHLREIDLTAAQLIAMGTAAVSILAAPKSNQVYVVEFIVFEITRTSTAFTGGGVVSFQYHTTTTSVPHVGTIPAAIVTGGAGTFQSMLGGWAGASALVLPAGEGIDITNAGGAFAAGTGTAKVFMAYKVLSQ